MTTQTTAQHTADGVNHLFTYTVDGVSPIALTLYGAMAEDMISYFLQPVVGYEVWLSYRNNDFDFTSKHVSAHWKSIALGLALSQQGFYALKDHNDTVKGMALLEASNWLSYGTLVSIGYPK